MTKLNDGAVILFQGDSITDGGRDRAANAAYYHALGHGYAYLIAARLGADHPDLGLTFLNRAISGHRVVDLYARWKEDALNLAPDLLSILVGINDVGAEQLFKAGVSTAKYETVYRMLLEETIAARPDVRLVLGEPFFVAVAADAHNTRAQVDERRQIVRQLAREFGAVFVPFQEVFDRACQRRPGPYWLGDGVHPSAAGHELMARAWLDAVQPVSGVEL
jgi:lysophospholipase L1-like esterase